MAASTSASGAGLRRVRYWLRDELGYPSGTQSGADGYAGRKIEGAKNLQSNIPTPQPITHFGDDIVLGQDSLPPNTIESLTLTTAITDMLVSEELFGQTIQTIGESQFGAMGTDRQGFENPVILSGYRQSVITKQGADKGKRQWITFWWPSVKLTPNGGQMAEQSPDDNTYTGIPTPVGKYPWGILFTTDDFGYTQATRVYSISDYPLVMERWDGDGLLDTFNTTYTPRTLDTTKVWLDADLDGESVAGTVSAIDTANDTITLSVAPAADTIIIALYQTTDQDV